MINFLKFGCLILVILLALNVNAQVNIVKPTDFTLVDFKGNEHHLFSYIEEGKHVVLDFFFPDCGPCKRGVEAMNEVFERYGCNQGDVIFLGLSRAQNASTLKRKVESLGVLYPVLNVGTTNVIAKQYGVSAFPTVVLISPQGDFVSKDIYPVSTENLVHAIYKKASLENNFGACGLSNFHPILKKNAQMTIFPNPIIGGGNIQIEISKAMNIQVNILNLLGQKIATPIDEFMYKSTDKYFEFKKLKPGLYLIQLLVEGSVISTQRFSKITP